MEAEWKPMWMRSPKTGRAHVYKLDGCWYTEWRYESGSSYAEAHFSHKGALHFALAVTS